LFFDLFCGGMKTLRASLCLAGALASNMTADQLAYLALDSGASMVDQALQLRTAHTLLLEEHLLSNTLPANVAAELEESRWRLASLVTWINTTRQGLREVFAPEEDGVNTSHVLRLLRGPTIEALPVELLSGPVPWSDDCPNEVPVKPFMLALSTLSSQRKQLDDDIAHQTMEFFSMRSERAEFAGKLEAHEATAGRNTTGRKETVAGLLALSGVVDNLLWKEPRLRKPCLLLLARAMDVARREVEGALSEALDVNTSVWGVRIAEAAARLREADKRLLAKGTSLRDAMLAKRELAEKMKNHLKAVLAQCLPPPQGGARSRYARFASTSSGSTAVQLTLEAADFISRSVVVTIPAVLLVFEEAADELRGGAHRSFRDAPSMSRWWEWLSDAEGGFLGFDEFMGRYSEAVRLYDQGFLFGGRLAGVHVMLTRWDELFHESGKFPG